jgi:hypothetical protein
MGTANNSVDIDLFRAGSQDFRIQTYSGGWNQALRVVGINTFACCCIQSPVVCATSCIKAAAICATTICASCILANFTNNDIVVCDDLFVNYIRGANNNASRITLCCTTGASTIDISPNGVLGGRFLAGGESQLYHNGTLKAATYSGGLCVTSGGATMTFSPHTSWNHLSGTGTNFWMQKPLYVETGKIGSYDEDLYLHRAGTVLACMTTSCFCSANVICAATCVASAALRSSNWIYAAGYFQGPIIYHVNTSSCICVNTGCSSNWALAMVFKPEGCVHTNTTNNWGGLRSGNVTVGYGGSYNTVENVVSGQQLHLRTSNSANIKIGDSGSTCTFICNCVQSPIVCATTCVCAPIVCATTAVCSPGVIGCTSYWNIDNWLSYTGGAGLYWPACASYHWYPTSNACMTLRNNQTSLAIRFFTSHGADTVMGFLYGDCSHNFGFLDYNGNWRVRVIGTSRIT